jgi:hypothetical protein
MPGSRAGRTLPSNATLRDWLFGPVPARSPADILSPPWGVCGLYLPQSWTGDRDRCRGAGIPGDIEFATKPWQAQAMISRAVKGRCAVRVVHGRHLLVGLTGAGREPRGR